MDTTIDGILNQRVRIEQPANGYRVAIDTVFLAAAVPAETGQKILDLGCGVGGAMLCLASRVPDTRILGVDIQDELVALCRNNIALNNMQNISVERNDVTRLAVDGFDHAMMNPPYHDETSHDASDNPIKRIANTEKEGDLVLWVQAAARALKDSGMLTIIHRADRLDDIFAAAENSFGTISIVPLLPKTGASPKRIIVRLSKKNHGVTYCSPVLLYRPGGGYTEAAENILRHAKPVEFI